MTRRPPVLAAALLLASGCGMPLLDAKIEDIRVDIPDLQLSGIPGSPTLADLEIDLGLPIPTDDDTIESEIRVTEIRLAWRDPASHPDFSQVTSATLTVIPGPESVLPEAVVATYVRDPADPDPDALVIAGDPGVNLVPYLDGTMLYLRADAQGSLPPYAWTASVALTGHLSFRAQVPPIM